MMITRQLRHDPILLADAHDLLLSKQGLHGKISLACSLAMVASVSLMLGGCASIFDSEIESRVSVFHRMSDVAEAGASYAVLPSRAEQENSLEFDVYAQQVAAALKAKGYHVVAAGEQPRYGVYLDLGVKDRYTVSNQHEVPQYGVTGYRQTTTTATVNTVGNTSNVKTTTTGTPTYGITGYRQYTTSQQVYQLFVNIDIMAMDTLGTSQKKVYEGRLSNEGNCANLPVIMPILLHGMLGDFPGQSGTVRTIKAPWTC